MKLLIITIVLCSLFEAYHCFQFENIRPKAPEDKINNKLHVNSPLKMHRFGAFNVPRCDDIFCGYVGEGAHQWDVCSRFYCTCERGLPSMQTCSAGRLFSPDTETCELVHNLVSCN